MKTKLIAAGLIAFTALSSGCVVAPAYDGVYYGPGYYGSAVIVAPPPVFYGGYYYGGYYGGYRGGYRGGYHYHGPYRRW